MFIVIIVIILIIIFLYLMLTVLCCAGKDESIAASMHVKPKDPKVFQTPAPCDYRPEKGETSVLKASPNFSFGVKTDVSKPNGVPGQNY